MSSQPQRVQPAPPAEGSEREPVRMLVALPALDEAPTIERVIQGIPRVLAGVDEVHVLVIDDGSSDATAELAERAGAEVISHGRRRGVGAAFHTALARAGEMGVDVFVTIDSDGQFDPGDIPALVAPVLEGRADFATASRFIDPSLEPEMPRMKRWGNRQMSRLVSGLTGQRYHDVSCGMRCYSRRALLNLHLLGTFTYVQEVFLNLSFKGMRIVEVPIAVRGEREYGSSRVAGNLWRYALQTSRILFRAYRDYNPMRFFGALALALALPAVALELFFFGHYALTGSFSPHKWAGFGGAALGVLALLLFFMGLVGDMLTRHRIYLEELLLDQRRRGADPDERR